MRCVALCRAPLSCACAGPARFAAVHQAHLAGAAVRLPHLCLALRDADAHTRGGVQGRGGCAVHRARLCWHAVDPCCLLHRGRR